MSKHATAEDKLHVSQQVRPKQQKSARLTASQKNQNTPQMPPKGTNANNQYR
jgi:hypothetical protein